MWRNRNQFRSARSPWLWLYVGANLVGFGWMLYSGIYIGDFAGLPVKNYFGLFVALLLTLISYWFILGPGFRVCEQLTKRITPIRRAWHRRRQIGLFIGFVLFALQLAFFAFGRVYGVGVAGSTERVTNLISLVFVLLPPDALFVVYYGVYRSSPMFKWNLGIWVLSNIYRGWSGWLLIVIFYEFCRIYYKGSLNIKKLAFWGALMALTAPVIYAVKLSIRGLGEINAGGAGLLDTLYSSLGHAELTHFIIGGVLYLIGRLQTVTDMSFVLDLSRELQTGFVQGAFAPFWSEGLLGAAYDRIMSLPSQHVLSNVLPAFAGAIPANAVGGWNVNVGLLSWLFVAPEYGIFYILYIAFLCGVSMILMKIASSERLSLDGLWFAWLIYLLPPWFGPFISYIWAIAMLCVFQLLGVIFYALIPTRPLLKGPQGDLVSRRGSATNALYRA